MYNIIPNVCLIVCLSVCQQQFGQGTRKSPFNVGSHPAGFGSANFFQENFTIVGSVKRILIVTLAAV